MVDDFEKLVDPDIASLQAISQYNALYASGNLVSATNILKSNPHLKNMIINAENMNKYRDAIISLERYYLNDVQQYLVNIVKHKGEWASNSKYTKYDVVEFAHEGALETYMAIETVVPIGTSPLDINYFIPLTLRGKQGVSGTGMSPRGYWSHVVEYYIDDCVVYNNVMWFAKRGSLASEPLVDNADWGALFRVPQQVAISNLPPSGQNLDDIWFNKDASNNITINRKNETGNYEQLFPVTKGGNVALLNGRTAEDTATSLTTHIDNQVTHIATVERTNWNNALTKATSALSRSGGTMTGALTAGGTQADNISQVRNMLIYPTGTDIATVPVPAKGTLVAILK